jgi:Peptidase family M41
MEKQTYFNIWYLIMAILGVFWLREIWVAARQVEPIAYSQFQHGNLSYQEDPSPFPPTSAGPPTERRYSEETAKEIDRAVREISGRAFAGAVSILSRNRRILEEGARMLLEKETLSEADIAVLAGSLEREGASGSNTAWPLRPFGTPARRSPVAQAWNIASHALRARRSYFFSERM